MLTLLLLACGTSSPTDTAAADTGDSASDSADSADTGTGDTADTADTADTGPTPIFSEPFDSLDTTVWLPGDWVLGATQLDPRNAHLVSGGVNLVHLADGAGGWSGVELYTASTFRGGMWSTDMVVPDSAGTVCATFLYDETDGVVNEIDVELLAGGAWFSVYADWTEADGYVDGPTYQHLVWPFPADFVLDTPHEYRFAWGKEDVRFFVDGADAGAVTIAPTVPLAVHVNHWTSTTWAEVQYPPADRLICRNEGIVAFPLPE